MPRWSPNCAAPAPWRRSAKRPTPKPTAAGHRAQRELQLKLIGEVGEALAALTRKPLVRAALRVMRMPAKLAGLIELHTFLEHGYNAFHRMGDPSEFLDTITTRETVILRQLYDGAARPFDIPDNA